MAFSVRQSRSSGCNETSCRIENLPTDGQIHNVRLDEAAVEPLDKVALSESESTVQNQNILLPPRRRHRRAVRKNHRGRMERTVSFFCITISAAASAASVLLYSWIGTYQQILLSFVLILVLRHVGHYYYLFGISLQPWLAPIIISTILFIRNPKFYSWLFLARDGSSFQECT